MNGQCIFCCAPVPPTDGDSVRFCGPCLTRPFVQVAPQSGVLAPSIASLREYVMSDAMGTTGEKQ